MKLALIGPAALVLAVGCGGGSGAAGPAQDPGSAFRSVGAPRIPVPAPPATATAPGAHTSYHGNGAPSSHGSYVLRGERPVAHGVWTFWLPDGHRQVCGRFDFGQPVGCFASWTREGFRVTGMASGGEIRPAA